MERGPRGGGFESYESWRTRQERPPQTLREEIERMYAEAPTELGREILGKILEMMYVKERAQKLAAYIATADPKDVTTYYPEKKLGVLLVCDTTSPKTYRVGDTVIKRGDRILQLHIPPRLAPAKQNNPLLTDLTESLQLTSDYIAYQRMNPRYVTGCTYEPIVRVAERRYGFNAVRVDIPTEWSERVRSVFHHYVDPSREPIIGFIYATTGDFQEKFPPRVQVAMGIEKEKSLPSAEISRMTEADLDDVIAMGLSTLEIQTGTDSPQFYFKETLQQWIQSPNGILLVAKIEGKLAGFRIADYNPDSRDGHLHVTVVKDEYRRRGVGGSVTRCHSIGVREAGVQPCLL